MLLHGAVGVRAVQIGTYPVFRHGEEKGGAPEGLALLGVVVYHKEAAVPQPNHVARGIRRRKVEDGLAGGCPAQA